MYGLTIRWSLHGQTTELAERLRDYVRNRSHGRFTGLPDLHQTIWTLREGGSFGATYVWATEAARAAFLAEFRRSGTPVTEIIGHRPDAVEEFEVVAIAEGGSGIPVARDASEPASEPTAAP